MILMEIVSVMLMIMMMIMMVLQMWMILTHWIILSAQIMTKMGVMIVPPEHMTFQMMVLMMMVMVSVTTAGWILVFRVFYRERLDMISYDHQIAVMLYLVPTVGRFSLRSMN